MLFMIGMGLGDENDVTAKGDAAIRSSSLVVLEMYTSILGVNTERLAEKYGKEIVIADREMVESEADKILEPAREGNVAFLVVGAALAGERHALASGCERATTHTDLALRALDMGIEVRVIHNASIMNAVASCGLQLYNFGQTITVPFWTDKWQPDSFFEKILHNSRGGLHTLCLLGEPASSDASLPG
ncbi:DPH5, partial [Symbiodinium sp. KB8]